MGQMRREVSRKFAGSLLSKLCSTGGTRRKSKVKVEKKTQKTLKNNLLNNHLFKHYRFHMFCIIKKTFLEL